MRRPAPVLTSVATKAFLVSGLFVLFRTVMDKLRLKHIHVWRVANGGEGREAQSGPMEVVICTSLPMATAV